MKTIRKRRNEGKTNYHKRFKLLQGGKPRIVVRKTNRYLLAQYVKSKEAQDKIIFGASTKILLKYGWPEKNKGSLKSLPASYLLGYYFGRKILEDKLETPIIDFGMHRNIYKTRIYSFVKGLLDAGVKVSNKKGIFPEKEKVETKKIPFAEIKSKIEKDG